MTPSGIPDIFCPQELKSTTPTFPVVGIRSSRSRRGGSPQRLLHFSSGGIFTCHAARRRRLACHRQRKHQTCMPRMGDRALSRSLVLQSGSRQLVWLWPLAAPVGSRQKSAAAIQLMKFIQCAVLLAANNNLNVHSKASLYEAFPAAEARRLVERFEWHYTPKHSSWLDLAESELGVLAAQCLDRRVPDKTDPHRRNRGLAARAQCKSHQIRLALHHQRCSH
jgi:hypothetical protein